MTNRNSNESIALPILFLAFVLFLGLAVGTNAQARVEYTNGNNMSEGDPGDGLDSYSGGSGSGYIPDSQVSGSGSPITFEFFNPPYLGVSQAIVKIFYLDPDGQISFIFSFEIPDDHGGNK